MWARNILVGLDIGVLRSGRLLMKAVTVSRLVRKEFYLNAANA